MGIRYLAVRGGLAAAFALSGPALLAPHTLAIPVPPDDRAVAAAVRPCVPGQFTPHVRFDVTTAPQLTHRTTRLVPAGGRWPVRGEVQRIKHRKTLRVAARRFGYDAGPLSDKALRRVVGRAEREVGTVLFLRRAYGHTSPRDWTPRMVLNSPYPRDVYYIGFRGRTTARIDWRRTWCRPTVAQGGVVTHQRSVVRTYGLITEGTISCEAKGQLNSVGRLARTHCPPPADT